MPLPKLADKRQKKGEIGLRAEIKITSAPKNTILVYESKKMFNANFQCSRGIFGTLSKGGHGASSIASRVPHVAQI